MRSVLCKLTARRIDDGWSSSPRLRALRLRCLRQSMRRGLKKPSLQLQFGWACREASRNKHVDGLVCTFIYYWPSLRSEFAPRPTVPGNPLELGIQSCTSASLSFCRNGTDSILRSKHRRVLAGFISLWIMSCSAHLIWTMSWHQQLLRRRGLY